MQFLLAVFLVYLVSNPYSRWALLLSILPVHHLLRELPQHSCQHLPSSHLFLLTPTAGAAHLPKPRTAPSVHSHVWPEETACSYLPAQHWLCGSPLSHLRGHTDQISFPSIPPQGHGARLPSLECFLFPRPGPSRTLNCQGSECHIPVASHHSREGSRSCTGGGVEQRSREGKVQQRLIWPSVFCILGQSHGAWRATGPQEFLPEWARGSSSLLWVGKEDEAMTADMVEILGI